MKVIGRKSNNVLVGFYAWLGMLVLITVVGGVLGVFPEILLVDVIWIGFVLYFAFFVFLFPKDIILFDEATREVVVNVDKKETVRFSIEDIEDIRMENLFFRDPNCQHLVFVVKGKDEVWASCIDNCASVMSELLKLK